MKREAEGKLKSSRRSNLSLDVSLTDKLSVPNEFLNCLSLNL